MAERAEQQPPLAQVETPPPSRAKFPPLDNVEIPGLSQAAEPPLWLVDPPGAFGFENPVEPPGAEAPPPLADAWEADPDQ